MAQTRRRRNVSDEKPALRFHSNVKLSERKDGPWLPSQERWQADYGDHHGVGPNKAEALMNLAYAIRKAEWEAQPWPKVCTCGIYGGHEPGCKNDPNPKETAKRRDKRASR